MTTNAAVLATVLADKLYIHVYIGLKGLKSDGHFREQMCKMVTKRYH